MPASDDDEQARVDQVAADRACSALHSHGITARVGPAAGGEDHG